MFSQQKTDSVTRSVSSRTLDGRRLTADVSILLHRAMGRSDAEAIATQVAGIVDDILGAQIIQGQAPITASELEAMTLAKTKGLGKIARVRISSLRLSVPPPGQVASMRPTPSRPPGTHPSVSPTAQSGTRLGASAGSPGGPGHASSNPPPGASASQAPVRPASPLPGTRLTPPRMQSPLPGTRLTPSAMPSAPLAPGPASLPPRANPSTSPPGVSPKSSSSVPPQVTSSSVPPSVIPNVESFGAAVAQPLRDAAARAILSVLSAVTSAQVDRLALLQGNTLAEELRQDVCACFAASIYTTATSLGEPHKVAAAKVEIACRYAFPDGNGPSATELGFYIAMDAPATELANRIATYLGCKADVTLLRAAVASCHSAFGERLVAMAASPAR